jgi:hypothetical protein
VCNKKCNERSVAATPQQCVHPTPVVVSVKTIATTDPPDDDVGNIIIIIISSLPFDVMAKPTVQQQLAEFLDNNNNNNNISTSTVNAICLFYCGYPSIFVDFHQNTKGIQKRIAQQKRKEIVVVIVIISSIILIDIVTAITTVATKWYHHHHQTQWQSWWWWDCCIGVDGKLGGTDFFVDDDVRR